MPISDKYKLIFVHIPKNAGTSITNSLGMTDVGHHKWSYYKSRYPYQWATYKKISVIRNSWERAVSCFEYAKMESSYWHSTNGDARAGKHLDYELLKDKSFEDCMDILSDNPSQLKHQGWPSQYPYIMHNNKLMVDKVIDIKNIDKELSLLLGKPIEIPLINVSKTKDYKEYYPNKKTIGIVEKKYKEDIDYFNFNFEEEPISI